MELNITRFFNEAAPRDYSASVAELGASAGADTWRAAFDDSADYPMLDTAEKREAFRAFVRSSGGWSDEEIRIWDDAELNALLIQWIAGDMRECDIGPETTPEQWAEYEARATEGQCPSRIFRADDSAVYFYIGS